MTRDTIGCVRRAQTYLGTEEVVGIWRLEHGHVGHDAVHLLVHDLEVAGVAEWEGAVGREGVGPREGGVEEVAGDVHVGVARAQCHHVRFGSVTGQQQNAPRLRQHL